MGHNDKATASHNNHNHNHDSLLNLDKPISVLLGCVKKQQESVAEE